jgi:peptidoglycan hydrolase-like protein with peptidoglycan-binding domain
MACTGREQGKLEAQRQLGPQAPRKKGVLMNRIFSRIAVMLVLSTILAFLISGTASAQSMVANHQTATSARTQAHSTATKCPAEIGLGNAGRLVYDLQSTLDGYRGLNLFPNKPYHVFPLALDGIFGPLTKEGVEDFQTAYHLQVDGIVGPQTWHALHYC